MEVQDQKAGIILTAASYILWGFLPIYWKLVQEIPAGEILAHRIIWSFVFMIALLLVLRKVPAFFQETKIIWKDKKKLLGITLASLVISLNWLLYIWAVNSDHVIQASLGYYINPLISILLGMAVLKEKLTKWQLISFSLAAIGVVNLTVNFGVFPWLSIMLALSFGIYGLLKKTVKISAMFGLTIETLIVSPIALIYLSIVQVGGGSTYELNGTLMALLIGGGVATAVPLLLFASGAMRIPLSMVGFLQYIAPTLMLVIGVFLYNEPFTRAHMISFICIWTALTIYTVSRMKWFHHLENKYFVRKKSFNH
ncbi:EamA family transporter RarD [Sediminibacillus massiliensis]|uniref:EamA family transporter RarD n=1 Tax=Sediminibacillus massiliensis TaxID=1926277 RepID=UPI000988671B|nr:EamA family transporter RarD [Sediminibacillus massiliensis]